MAEMTLRAYAAEAGMKSVSCRYFTVYGERCHENHAIMAMIARAFIGQDPFVVWEETQVMFADGLHQTIDWYRRVKDRAQVSASLDMRVAER
ncbi:MAG: NAD-dependent epimerase/dehydratase family protein [Acidimicrobiia bacterium]|nr:NAD-dependent epimerase/dehydratase family protein [Acidimicrobiia bacterium]